MCVCTACNSAQTLRAYARADLSFVYNMYDFNMAQLTAAGDLFSDSRIYKLHFGLDGYLYFLGQSGAVPVVSDVCMCVHVRA